MNEKNLFKITTRKIANLWVSKNTGCKWRHPLRGITLVWAQILKPPSFLPDLAGKVNLTSDQVKSLDLTSQKNFSRCGKNVVTSKFFLMKWLSWLKVLRKGSRPLHFSSFYVDGPNSCSLFTLFATFIRHCTSPTIPLPPSHF